MFHRYNTIRIEVALVTRHARLLTAGDVPAAYRLTLSVSRKADRHFDAMQRDPGRAGWHRAKWRGYDRIAAILRGQERGWDAHFGFINDLERDISQRKRAAVLADQRGEWVAA